MSIPVKLSELADAMAAYRFAYLLTIADDGRAHAVAVRPELADGGLRVGDLGRRTAGNLAARPAATLLWPPSDPAGYSLIVDGDAADGDGEPRDENGRRVVTIVPSRAVLHRPASPGDGAADGGSQAAGAGAPVAGAPAPGCVSDCVEIDISAG